MKTLTKAILAALIAALVLTACSNSSDGDSKATSTTRPLVSYYIKATGGKYLVTDIYAAGAKLPDPSARTAAAPARAAQHAVYMEETRSAHCSFVLLIRFASFQKKFSKKIQKTPPNPL
jgi:hypothetical protein